MQVLGPVLLIIVAIVVISGVVGAISQFMNKLNEANAPAPRNAVEGTRQTEKEMDRFLAEIDRLRKKNAESTEPTAAKPPAVAKPVVRPKSTSRNSSRGEKPKARVVAELVEPQQRRRGTSNLPSAPSAPGIPESLPLATVLGPASTIRVSRLPQRDRPDPKTNFAKNLTNLLNSGQGAAMAIILQEILGPPKSKKH